jgi:hypothetical protein
MVVVGCRVSPSPARGEGIRGTPEISKACPTLSGEEREYSCQEDLAAGEEPAEELDELVLEAAGAAGAEGLAMDSWAFSRRSSRASLEPVETPLDSAAGLEVKLLAFLP